MLQMATPAAQGRTTLMGPPAAPPRPRKQRVNAATSLDVSVDQEDINLLPVGMRTRSAMKRIQTSGNSGTEGDSTSESALTPPAQSPAESLRNTVEVFRFA